MQELEKITFNLDSSQIKKLTEHTQISSYYTRLKKLEEEFEGLWYEIESVAGNWSFKDRVLQPLFRELDEILSNHLKKIQEYDNELFELDEYDKESRDHKRKVQSLQYIIKSIPKKLHMGTKPSNKFSHVSLEKVLRVMRKRFLLALDRIKTDIRKQLRTEANTILRERVIPSLEYKISCYPKKTWDPSVLVHDLTSYEYMAAVRQILLPDCANTEYHIGLKPLWVSKNGNKAYYFTDNPNKRKEITDETRRVVFIKEKDSPWSEIFEEWGIEQKAWYENWFSAKDVRSQLIWEFGGYFAYKSSFEKPLSEEEFHAYLEECHSKLQEFLSHYGRIYSPEEWRAHYEESIIDRCERSLYLDEISNTIKENAMKMFPLKQLQEAFTAQVEPEQVIEVVP